MHSSRTRFGVRLSVATSFLSLLLLLFIALAPGTSWARRGEAPLSPVGQGSIGEPTLRIDAPDVALLKAEDAENKVAGQKTLRYASPVDVSISPMTDGRWETTADGTRVWRMEVVGPGATDINIGFERFRLPYGGKLWVISTEADYYEGPYTWEDNEEHGQLWVPVVPGERAIVELQLPAETKFEPELEMTHVGYGYKDVFSMDGLPKQGSCNNDVVCPEGDPWRDQIKAVAAYSLGGSIFCTGQMVIDADQTFRPFFLTAYHCGLNASNAPSLVVYWNFESPNCGDLSGGSLADNQTGATFRSSRQDVDMCLVELDDYPDPAHDVYYSGWDKSGNTPQGSVAIHHPNGDEKAISFNDDALTTGASCILGSGTPDSHWFVDNWEDGTTEPGSSGSGLWDPDSQLLVGFLSGGLASCTVIDYDCYGRFSVAWDGPSSSSRLRDWLDPQGTAPDQVPGARPSGAGIVVFDSADGIDDCSGSSNGVIEPGETVSIDVTIGAALSDVSGISGVLTTSSPGVTVAQDNSTWPDVLVGSTQVNDTPFVVQLDAGVPCFSDLSFTAEIVDGLGNVFTLPFTLPVGQLQTPGGLPQGIPDGSAAGTTSSFTVAEDLAITDLDLRVAISHTWIGDLIIRLTSPAGTTVTLMDRPGVPASTYGCGDDDLDITFDDDSSFALESYCAGSTPWYTGVAAPAQALSAFNGESTQGTWTLFVSDNAGADTGQIVDWELITTPGLSPGTCEPCSAGPTDLYATTTAGQRVSVYVVPDGSGDRLDQAQLWDGVVGNVPAIVDATVHALVTDGGGNPYAGFPAADMLLGSSAGNLVLCADGGSADGPTDATGVATFSGAIAGGGHSDLGAAEKMTVTGTGLSTSYDVAGGLEITFNSADSNGDLVVDLADVGEFSAAFVGGVYDYAFDFQWDGIINLGDIGVLSQALGVGCPVTVVKRPALQPADGELGVFFDQAGIRRSRGLTVGEEAVAWISLTGDVARAGIRGWEASLRTSSNVRVLAVEPVEGSVDLLEDTDFAVGTGPEGLRAESGVLRLARVRLRVTDDAPAHLYLDASPVGSGGAEGPVVLTAGEQPQLRALVSDDAPVAALNDEFDGTPGASVVTRAAITNVPNPFNPSTEIQFALPRTGRVEIRVFDVSGRLVRRFDLGEVAAGEHSTVWRGDDHNGREVVSGVYFSRLYVDGEAAGSPRKMSLLK